MRYSKKYLLEYLDIGAAGANVGDAVQKENKKYARKLKKQAARTGNPYIMRELSLVIKNLKKYNI